MIWGDKCIRIHRIIVALNCSRVCVCVCVCVCVGVTRVTVRLSIGQQIIFSGSEVHLAFLSHLST